MSTNAPAGHESPATTGRTDAEADERDVRAVTQYLTVLDDVGQAAGADDLYQVVSESGKSYTVDARSGVCECPDATHRNPEGGCKHARRVAFATGARALPPTVDAEDVDDALGQHVGGEVRHVATDGAGAELLSTPETDGPTWEGPFPEYDRYGNPTGERYVRCRSCRIEVLEGDEENASHRDGCSHANGGGL